MALSGFCLPGETPGVLFTDRETPSNDIAGAVTHTLGHLGCSNGDTLLGLGTVSRESQGTSGQT